MLGDVPLFIFSHTEDTKCALCDGYIPKRKLMYPLFPHRKDRKPEAVHPECALAALEKMVDKRRARLQQQGAATT